MDLSGNESEPVCERSGSLPAPSGHPLPVIFVPDLFLRGDGTANPSLPRYRYWAALGHSPQMPIGFLGYVGHLGLPTLFTFPQSTHKEALTTCPYSCFKPTPWAPPFLLSLSDPFFGELSKWSRKFGPSASLSRLPHWIRSLLRWESCN